MKIRISNYTFDASAKTITFDDYAGISLEGVLLVTNTTDNIIIYNFADTAKGGTVATNVLTLDHDVTSMADTDDLLIYYDDTDAIIGAGDVGTGTQRMVIATDDINLAAIKTAVEIIDDWDDTNYCNMNMNVAGTDVATNAGNMSAQTLRVVVATNDTHFGTVGAGSDVDGVVHGQLRYIGETDNSIKTAIEKIDDWEGAGNYADYCKSVMYIDNGSGSPIIALGDAAGHLQIDVISAPSTAVTGTFYQVTQPVSIAGTVTVDLAGNNDVTVTSGSIDVLGDTAHDAADSGDPVKIGHKAVLFDSSAPPNAAAAENDRVNSIADEYGRQYVETTHPNYWDVSADYGAAQTNATVKAAPGAGLSLYITDMVISNGAVAGNITLLDGSGGTVLVEIYPAINGGMSTNLRTPIKLTAATLLAITSTSCTTHSVMISGFIAP